MTVSTESSAPAEADAPSDDATLAGRGRFGAAWLAAVLIFGLVRRRA